MKRDFANYMYIYSKEMQLAKFSTWPMDGLGPNSEIFLKNEMLMF